jgi:acyl-CoA thioesterase FadM
VPDTFSINRRVQFAETDMAGIVHFSNYFRWMEEVEHAFFRSVGPERRDGARGGSRSAGRG